MIRTQLLLILSSFVLVSLSVAQIERAELTGTVSDASGAVITGANVQAVASATGIKSEARTNSSGVYVLPGLAVGHYTVTISQTGFETQRTTDVLLEVGLTRVMNAQLKVGVAPADVEVRAAYPLEQTSPQLSGVINDQQISDLPVNGRNWATLLIFAPGAIDDGGGDQRTIRFAGRGRDDNNYMIDGVDATGIQEQAQKSSTRLQISEDAVSEYRVSTALYAAEYGGGDGGQINIVSKSGTNQYHGSVFEYFRNSALDARAFNDFDGFTGNPVIPPFRLNQFGATFGGPIQKDKTFFFASYEGLRQSQNRTLVGNVPSAPLRAAILATSPVLAPIVNAYPAGNTNFGVCNDPTVDPCADQFVHQGSITVNEDSFLVRLDHRFSDRTTFYARAQRDVGFTEAPLGNLLDTQQIHTNPANYLLALEHSFSPGVFNEFKFGINRSPFLNPQASVLPYSVSTNAFEQLNNNNTDHEIGTTFSFVDNLAITRGRNTFKMGIEVRRVRLNQGITADNNYSFTDNLSLINNQLDSVEDRNSWCCRGLRHTLVMPYFQDEWRVRPNLTLNLGLRWEYYSVITEAHGRMTVFDLACGGICPPGSPAYFPYHKNFDPRVGISWAPKALHDKTVIRIGFGIYSGMGQNDDLNAALESNTTRFGISSADVAGGILPFPVDPSAFPGGTFLAPRALYRHRRDMYVEEYGLSVQQLLPRSFVFQSSYIGSHGVRLFARSYVNLCEQPFDGTNCIRPLPNFSQIDIKYNNGTSHFDALELSLQRRLTHGWMWTTQYMWSHALNDGSVGGGEAFYPENVQCQRCEYGPSAFDVRHNVVMASTYELPFGRGHALLGSPGIAASILGGWELSGTGVFHTGHPLTVTMGISGSQVPDGNFRSNQRPDLVPGVSLTPPGGQTPNDWVNINAFTMPPVDANGIITHFGDAPNGVIRAPHVWEMDLALQKAIRLTETFALEFRAEAFNIFNHTQYGDPSNLDILGSNFGQINTTVNYNTNNDNFAPPNTGMGLPRQLQLMLRVKF